MGLITAGYWQTTYFPKSYWPTDYWVEYGVGVVHSVSGTIDGVSSVSGRATVGGVESGVNEFIINEFQFPYIPETIPEEVRVVFLELRTMLEQQLIGDFYISGDLHVDGDLNVDY